MCYIGELSFKNTLSALLNKSCQIFIGHLEKWGWRIIIYNIKTTIGIEFASASANADSQLSISKRMLHFCMREIVDSIPYTILNTAILPFPN